MLEIDQKQIVLKELRKIPGVGKSIAEDLWNLNIRSIADLETLTPQTLYENLRQFQGEKVDRCMLYVFRCAVYFATHTKHDPELLKWWNWKDRQ